MSDKHNPGKSRLVSLVIGFFILFVVTFSLGIIVGKGLVERATTYTEKQETTTSRAIAPQKTADTDFDESYVLQERVSEPDTEPREFTVDITSEAPEGLPVKENIKEDLVAEAPKPVDIPEENKTELEQGDSATQTQSNVKAEPAAGKPLTTPKPQNVTLEAAIEEIAKTDKRKRDDRVKLPPIDPGGSFTVQIGSFTDKKAADSVLKSMKRKGYPAYINIMTDSDKKKWYRVRIGTFENSETASEYGESLQILEPEVKIVFITRN